MLDEIVTKLPKDTVLSDSLKEKAEAYLKIWLFGIVYYIPITKEVKKLFKIRRRGKKFIFTGSYKDEQRFKHFVRDIINSVYLQVRDTVGSEIHSQLSTQIETGFGNMYDRILEKKINQGFQKLLPYKNNKE